MNVHKVISLTPPLEPDSLYYVADGDDTQAYITDNSGVAKNVTNDQAAEIVASQAHIATVLGNPHGVTKSEVGLGQSDNTSDANKPVSILQAAADSLRILISSIVDNLTSNDTDKPLSANQGLVLKGLVDGKQPTIDQDLNTTASPSFAGLNATGDSVFGVIGAPTATTDPLNVSYGSTYGSNAAGSNGNLKWDLYTSTSGGVRYGIGMSNSLMEFQAGTNGGLGFFVDGGTRALDINTNGRVGIGTLNPSEKLDVVGNAKLSGDIEITDTTKGSILKSPNGTRWRITIDNSGNLITTSI